MKFSVVALFLLPVCVVATTTKKPLHSAVTRKHSAAAVDKGTGAARKTASTGVRGKRSRYAATKRKPPASSYQTHPTPERYQEIQQALADKGYYKGAVNGQWGDDSTAALQKFQTDHQLYNDGKISSLSLIQLGLGPKHDGAAVTSPVPLNPAPPMPAVTEEPVNSQATVPQ